MRHCASKIGYARPRVIRRRWDRNAASLQRRGVHVNGALARDGPGHDDRLADTGLTPSLLTEAADLPGAHRAGWPVASRPVDGLEQLDLGRVHRPGRTTRSVSWNAHRRAEVRMRAPMTVRRDEESVHVAAVLGRQDGGRAHVFWGYPQVSATCLNSRKCTG